MFYWHYMLEALLKREEEERLERERFEQQRLYAPTPTLRETTKKEEPEQKRVIILDI